MLALTTFTSHGAFINCPEIADVWSVDALTKIFPDSAPEAAQAWDEVPTLKFSGAHAESVCRPSVRLVYSDQS